MTQPTYYVSPAGSDSNDGRTVGTAFRTIGKAATAARAGDLVWILSGTYREYVRLTHSGTDADRIVFEAPPGHSTTVDGSAVATNTGDIWNQAPVLRIVGDFITVRGLEIIHAAADGVYVTGTNVVLDALHVHHGYLSGIRFWETFDGQVLNSTIHDVFDYATGGQHADCISVSGEGTGGRITIRNNHAFNCSDDGIDTWKSYGNVIEYNVVHHTGLGSSGNGNGFKLGPGGGNLVRGNVAYENRAGGFTANEGSYNRLYNNTAFRNHGMNFANDARRNAYKNNLSVDGGVQVDGLAVQRNNSWHLGITDPKFASTDPASPLFLRLANGSPAIDKGMGGIGEVFSGLAPDLGAYEFDGSGQNQVSPPVSRCLLVPLSLTALSSDGGVAHTLPRTFGIPPDSMGAREQSQLRLFENQTELGPAHAWHQDIRTLGGGRFSHWTASGAAGDESLHFSASDNSDPRTNGRTYSYCLGAGTPFTLSFLP
jgi:parallel beta-helix repeat protein